MMTNNVHPLRGDVHPMQILAQHQTGWPVMVEPIAKELGIKVIHLPLGKSIAGQIMRDPRQGGPSGFLVHVNSDESKNRQKFTLAHEIAHFILHRDLIEDAIVDDTMYRSELGNYYEVQANQLAVDILMPIRLVKKALEQTNNPSELAKMFGVSEQAMKIRLAGIDARTSNILKANGLNLNGGKSS